MTKEKKEPKKAKPKAKSFKDELLNSSIANRISPTTLQTFLSFYNNDKDAVVKNVIKHLCATLPLMEVKEVKAVLNDLIKLIDNGN